MTLQDLRGEIDKVNRELIALFSKRLLLTKKVAKFKKENLLPVWDGVREEKQYEEIRKIAKEMNVSPGIIHEIFKLFIDYSRLEMKMEMDKP